MAKVISLPDTVDFKRTKNGGVKPTLTNLLQLINALQIQVRYNVIFKEIEIEIPGKTFSGENRADASYGLMTHFCVDQGYPVRHLTNYLATIAEENSYNPITDWIDSKPWDGTSRMQDFFDTITSAQGQELKEIYLKRWALAATAAMYEKNGIGAAGVLVLQGPQYQGKTNWFRNLVPQEVRQYIKDGLSIDPSDRDSKKTALSYWLVELGEMGTTLKAGDKDTLKAFLTSDRDSMRLAYGRGESKFTRRTVFCGSINESLFLRDRTGNRRFFVIPCAKINHTHGVDMQQFWAEMKVLYSHGEPWYLQQDEFEMLNEANEQYMLVDPLEEKIQSFYDWDNYLVTSKNIDWKTATEILEDIGWKSFNRSTATLVGVMMPKLNFNRSVNKGGKRVWAVPYPRTRIQGSF